MFRAPQAKPTQRPPSPTSFPDADLDTVMTDDIPALSPTETEHYELSGQEGSEQEGSEATLETVETDNEFSDGQWD